MIRLPWNNETAPSVMIEITDACNVSCRACYKKKGTSFKSLEQIEKDLDAGLRLRPLHTVTISGGEPTLHPELCRIIRLMKKRNVHVFLLTNGVLLDQLYISRLSDSGLDSILFHVDLGQQRPDLPVSAGFDDVRKRLSELIYMAVTSELDVSISATLYDDCRAFLQKLSNFVFNNPDISFLYISKGIDPGLMMSIEDRNRIFSEGSSLDVPAIRSFYQKEYGLEPFAYIPDTANGDPVWLSYFVPVVYNGDNRMLFRIQSNLSDHIMIMIPKIFSGRYTHKTTQKPFLTLIRVVINALSTLRLGHLVRFLVALSAPSAILRHKMIAYDNGPLRTDDGGLIHCEYCPTAIVRNGVLLPCCTADFGQGNSGGN